MPIPLLPSLHKIVRIAVMAATLMLPVMQAQAAGKSTTRQSESVGVAWLAGTSEAAVDAAFAQAKAAAKPVLLYWGAAWCPPCNQLKATLFNRQDFIALTRTMVPVYLDGDLPGAQKSGARFKVVGYPTLILFSPDGTEITRLPGEADAGRVIKTLTTGFSGGESAKALLADARAGKPLSIAQWRTLAFYSWETDEAQLVDSKERAALLADLARRSASTCSSSSTRLWLKSLMANEDANGKLLADSDEQLLRLQDVLEFPTEVELHADIIIEGAKTIVRSLMESADPARPGLLAAYDNALRGLQNDEFLSRGDQTGALIARIELSRIDQADDAVKVALPPALLAEVSAFARRMDAEITDGYERQAVITSVAHLLGSAGLWAESDALLKANLKKSHSPYYLMSQLGGNARKLGRNGEALDWFERAYATSKGPATRLQWGASYVGALIDLAPQDAPRIEKAVSSVFADAAKDKAAFYERSGRSLKRVVGKLVAWNTADAHAAEVKRLRARYDGVCRGIAADDTQRAMCVALWPAA
jgi:thioredoxin-related protein